MPRLNSGQELFRYLTSLKKYVPATVTPGSTTLSADAAADLSLLPFTALTNFEDGDFALVKGTTMELVQIDGTPALSMPILQPTAFAHEAGAAVIEMAEADLGHIDENGITPAGTFALTPVKSAVARTAIAYYAADPAELSVTFNLRGWNNLNLAFAFGAPDAEAGSGTAADPYTVGIGAANVGTLTDLCLRAYGTRFDGATVQVDFFDCRVEVGVSTPVGGTAPAILPVTLKCVSLVQRIWS